MPALGDDEVQQHRAWVRSKLQASGMHRAETVLVKNGPRVFKTVSLLYFGKSADDITNRELRLKTSKRDGRGGFAVDRQWSCENEEIEAIRSFLEAELGADGDYRIVTAGASAQQVLDYLADGVMPTGFLAAMAKTIVDRVEVVSALSDVEGAELVGMAVDLRKQQQVTEEFERVVLDPASRERDLQEILESNWWLLGGNYVAKADRRSFTVLDQYDLALLRADNVLHVVELKQANVPRLVKPYRSHFTVGDAVNEAVNQAMNYLRTIDEGTHMIKSEFGVACRRAQASVIIGHPTHNGRSDVSDIELREAIRTYNSHLSRVEVLTYEDVLTTAKNSVSALARQVDAGASFVEVGHDDD